MGHRKNGSPSGVVPNNVCDVTHTYVGHVHAGNRSISEIESQRPNYQTATGSNYSGSRHSMNPVPETEALYWSDDPLDVARLRDRCRLSFDTFGQGRTLWGAGLYPLIGCLVLVTRAGEPGRIVQVLADAGEVRVVLAEGTPHSRCITIPPPEVLLPWLPDHLPMFQRASQRQERRQSSTGSSVGSTNNPLVGPVRPTEDRMVEEGGPTSLLAATVVS